MKITSNRFDTVDSLDIELRDMNIVCFFFSVKEWRLGKWRFEIFEHGTMFLTPWFNIYIF